MGRVLLTKTLRIFAALCITAMLGIVSIASAQKVYSINDVPNPHLTDRSLYVSNPDGTLSTQTVAELNRELLSLQQETSIEVAVVVIESIGEMALEDFGIGLFRKWGIGKKEKDNGLLILLISGDRMVRFEVGYRLEGVLTDAVCKRIQTMRMMQYLERSDWDGAALEAVKAVKEYVTDPNSDLRNEADPIYSESDSPLGFIFFIFGGIIVMMLVALFAMRRANKCPQCGHQMKNVDSKTTKLTQTSTLTTTTLRCPKCGYTTIKNTTHHSGGGMIGGFGGGRGFGGGGFGGGGFGGGSAGGGGASTRF